MASYGTSILPYLPSRYTTINASVDNGKYVLGANGKISCQFNQTDIGKVPKTLIVHAITDRPVDMYEPADYIRIEARTGASIKAYTLFPCYMINGVFSAELTFDSEVYEYFTVDIYSKTGITYTTLELRPELDSDLSTVIDGVEQSLPKLLSDYNKGTTTVMQRQKTIAMITCYLENATDLQGHLEVAYSITEPCKLTLRFFDNGAEELFAPLEYDLSSARGNVGIPHAYLNRSAGIHSIWVTAQVSAGVLSIRPRGTLFTIDGGYMARRLVDIAGDVQDISIRQLSEDFGPDQVWVVGLDNDVATVRSAAYSIESSYSFEPQYTLGNATMATIEFDGNWVRREASDIFTLETEEFPWVFWVDTNEDLYAQKGTDASTLMLLASGVKYISAVRGYKSTIYKDKDQGLVVAYVAGEDRGVYYRAFAYSDNGYIWGTPYQLECNTGATSVAVSRLNDYRLCFAVSYADESIMLITDRTYVAQSIAPEYVRLNVHDQVSCITSISISDPEISKSFTYKAVAQEGLQTAIVECNRPLFVLGAKEDLIKHVKITGTNATLESISVTGNIIEISFDKMVTGTVTLSFDYFLQQCIGSSHIPLPGAVSVVFNYYVYASSTEHVGLLISDEVVTLQNKWSERLTAQLSENAKVKVSGDVVSITHYTIGKEYASCAEHLGLSVYGEVCTITQTGTGSSPI